MGQTIYFTKEDPAIRHLICADAQMAELVERVGAYTLELRTDYFATLIRSIIGQQLSAKVARVIWQRFVELCGEVRPESVLALDEESLRGVGFSRTKVCYIKDLAQKVLDGKLDLETVSSQSDEDIMKALTQVKGIGQWTAEMFMIFSLGRPDIWALDDVGLQRAIKWLHGLSEPPKGDVMKQYGQAWKPYRSVASLYLWEAINRDLVREKM
jgi:DNA-3-methyladenine glycosylase II